LVEYKLPKLGVAGSNPVARSNVARRVMMQALAPASPFEVARLVRETLKAENLRS
jgi:hypothetical protein